MQVGVIEVRGKRCLVWSDGTRAAERGEDLGSAARRMTSQELEFWWLRFKHGHLPHEAAILEAELQSRNWELVAE